MYILPSDEILTDEWLCKFIDKHASECAFRYQRLLDAYKTNYPIFHEPPKPKWKPDNRIAVNFAKYIVDTMNGFFLGHPIKVTVDEGNEEIEKYVELIDQYNDQDDNNAELSKITSIFGKGYEMYYNDETSNVCITYLTPMDAFMVKDDSVLRRERYFVRLYVDTDNVLHGSVSDESKVMYFTQKGKIIWDEKETAHGFDGIPATEYVENEEQMGIFEPVLTMIDAYNKALSEKANDVDYFADAYLKILGAKVEEDDVKHIRDDRIMNFDDALGESIPVVDFLSKPDADTTQENLINRLHKLIFQISMVADISDENFGTSSGIAMKYKLQAMSNLEKTKERKFTSGMNRRYKLIFSNPVSGMKKDDWVKLHYHFTPNFPANVLEESQIVGNLEGVVSKDTQLSVLSIVDNVAKEIEKLDAEQRQLENSAMSELTIGGLGDAGKDMADMLMIINEHAKKDGVEAVDLIKSILGDV
ncbi:phage portal protein [Hespellia stercorisuis]|uniref:Phage portal protein, SPP1 family n=1 Tax=Hespellia stercorisuis DSM 15480 TaxID=1121950 RepID=A0A1M6RFN5_9FIRM|nr:phage portal protein [Hespellia stercorisuis]SHK31206.1 phage portal protein, SPP1 family [Hespellia stercorisuis DSM 15480]